MDAKEKQKKADEMNKDMFFYYLRDHRRDIFGGVCLKKVDGVWCRGISLLSHKDKFDKNEARKQARSRLIHAICTKKDDFPVNPDAHESSMKLKTWYSSFFEDCDTKAYKSKYNAVLSVKEEEIVKDVQ